MRCKDRKKILCKSISVLSVYNYQLIIHAGYAEELCIINSETVGNFLKMICSARNTSKERNMWQLLHICSCRKGVKYYRKLIHPLHVILIQSIGMIHLQKSWKKGCVEIILIQQACKKGGGCSIYFTRKYDKYVNFCKGKFTWEEKKSKNHTSKPTNWIRGESSKTIWIAKNVSVICKYQNLYHILPDDT